MNTREDSLAAINQRVLSAAIAEVRARLESHLSPQPFEPAVVSPSRKKSAKEKNPERVRVSAAASGKKVTDAPSALDTLVSRFALTTFERAIILLCAGIEFETRFAALCASAQNGRPIATFGLALAALPDAHWSAIAPTGSLRRWRLIDVDPSAGLTSAPLRLDERVLHYLAGIPYLDPRLRGICIRVSGETELAPAQTAQAQRIVDALVLAQRTGHAPLFELRGTDLSARTNVAVAAAEACDLKVFQLRAADLPHAPEDRAALARLWEREALLSEGSLLLTVADDDAPELVARARSFAELVRGIVFFSSPIALQNLSRPVLTLIVDQPAAAEQIVLWTRALGAATSTLNGQLARVATQFSLDARGVRVAAAHFAANVSDVRDEKKISALLWSAAREQASITLDSLAQKIEPAATWDDLVLPTAQKHTLRTIVAQVRQRARVCETWGFARKGARGLGLSTLFAGPSGTGKTMAAEVIARELELDLFRIDLSAMVSKYIGETEKNLRKIFDAADRSGAILLFDEADALFGKRSEVRDSHDRHANIEVSYLLQRVEAYRGVAILTTNMKQALDTAFLRRLRFIVPFAFPDTSQRLEIWRRVFPAETPVGKLDYEKLARLSLAGGHIRNVALNAAFLAADAAEPVRMHHLQQAAQSEYAKLEKSLSDSETENWS